jgi:hypothetical protein
VTRTARGLRLRRSRALVPGSAVLVAFVVALAACSSSGGGGNHQSSAPSSGAFTAAECAANKAAGTVNFVSPFGFDASAGIIDVFVAQKLGYFTKMCIATAINAAAENGNELVSSDRAQVTGFGSAADALLEASGQANIVSVATWATTSDYVLLANQSITKLTQLPGKTLAYHTTLPVAIRAMITAAGVDLSKIHLVATNNYDPTQVTRGQVDALQGYQSNEVLSLKAAGQKFTEFIPSNFGVKGTYNVMSFNGAFLAAHRQTAADWMRADLYASTYCLTHQTQCVTIEHQYAVAAHAQTAFPLAHEQQEWALESKLIVDHPLAGAGLGVQTYAEWRPELNQLVKYKMVKSPPTLSKAEDVTLTAGLYHGKTLIWP